MIAKYPRFAQQIANANLLFKDDLPYHTAATDGKNIYFDPNYLESLNDDEKLFIIAHELMHIKFEHMYRMTNKNGQMRDAETWNIATDAIINANLERDGFKIKQGYVNKPEALKYTAEEFYEKLLTEKNQQNKENQSQGGNSGNNNQSQQNGQNNQKNESQNGQSGDHTYWKKAFEDQEQQKDANSSNKEQENQQKEDKEQLNNKQNKNSNS